MNDALIGVLLAIVAPLAAYRITRLIIDDKITEPVFDRLRTKLENRYIRRHAKDDDDFIAMHSANSYQSPIAYMLSCYWCAGFWVSGLQTMVMWYTYSIEYPILVMLAMSTIVGLLSKVESD